MINRVNQVILPVSDLSAAKEFWTTLIGLQLVDDQTFGDERWIEVRPPDQELRLVLSLRLPGEVRRAVPDKLPHSDIFFTCSNIDETYAELSSRGVRFPAPPSQQHWGWWAIFEDNEATRYALGQS
jgi:predicted enzyme related to lactoylglutathione lyase